LLNGGSPNSRKGFEVTEQTLKNPLIDNKSSGNLGSMFGFMSPNGNQTFNKLSIKKETSAVSVAKSFVVKSGEI
jgi:hypothetical protein